VTERNRGGSKAYYLFLDIVDVVARSPHGLTVREIGRELNLQPALVAHCIALHFYLETKHREPMPIPPPNDYRVPGIDDVIDHATLESRGWELTRRDGDAPDDNGRLRN
jgi:hypothetical protein